MSEPVDFMKLHFLFNRMKSGKVFLLAGLLLGLSVILAATFYVRSEDARFTWTLLNNFLQGRGYKSYVTYSVFTCVDYDLHLNIELSVPFTRKRQAKDLMRKRARIQNEIILSMSRPKIRDILRDRNLKKLKHELVEVISRVTTEPIDAVYYNRFTLMYRN